MGWVEAIGDAVDYIENNITEDITVESIAKQVSISPFYFQKGFSMLCGFTVGEYVRFRRLSLAGKELVATDNNIIDIALKYGYDSPDSFTKAFTRFHGVTPSAVRKGGAMVKSFAALKLKFSLEGGYIMDYQIIKKDAFTVIGSSKVFTYENAKDEIPMFWNEHYTSGKCKTVCGNFGINIDDEMGNDKFEYLIADPCEDGRSIPDGFVKKVIPAFTWAVFACKGKMPESFQNVYSKVFSEWLPNSKDYEIAAGYCIEMYEDPAKYSNGVQDSNYYSEVWVPVKAK